MSDLPWLRSLVKDNVAAKHGSSKLLTSNELWLLELQIKSTCILAGLHTRCIMGYVQIYEKGEKDAMWDAFCLFLFFSAIPQCIKSVIFCYSR